MSKLLKALEQTRARRRGTPCTVGTLLQALPAEERDALKKALHDPARSKSMLSEAIRVAFSAKIQENTLTRHARGQCACEQ